MKFWDELSTASKIAGAAITIITLTTMLVSGAWATYTHFEKTKTAYTSHVEIYAAMAVQEQRTAALQLEVVQERMLKLEVEKIRVDNRSGLTPVEKAEQKEIFNKLIKVYEHKEECYKKGKLECVTDE